jgi:hypothetical protein
MRAFLSFVVLFFCSASMASGRRSECDLEKSKMVVESFRAGIPLGDPYAIQGDVSAELLYLLLAAERFKETGKGLAGLPFRLSSPLNRAASDAHDDYVRGLGMHSSFVRQLEEHGPVAAYALMAIRNAYLAEESIDLLEAAGARGALLRATTVGQYVTLRMSEPGDHLGKVRRAIDWGGGLSQVNVVYLRLSELMPESTLETVAYIRDLAKRGVLRGTQRLAAKKFLALTKADVLDDILLSEVEMQDYQAFQKAIVGSWGSCLTNRGYVFNSSVHPGGRR